MKRSLSRSALSIDSAVTAHIRMKATQSGVRSYSPPAA